MINIIAIGAYERDNFGDLLFFSTLKKYFEGRANIVPASIIYSDMSSSLGEIVLPYHYLLKHYKWDAVWVVGGEIGSVIFDDAIQVDMPTSNVEIFNNTTNKEYVREFIDSANSDGIAYIPNMANYPINNDTPLIINSVGLRYLENHEKHIDASLKKLSRANFLSVRDNVSSEALKKYGIEHNVYPDIVSSISALFPLPKTNTKPYMIFHANENVLKDISPATMASVIARISNEHNLDVEFFLAGSVRLHDSIEKYEEIIAELKNYDFRNNVKRESFANRDPIFLAHLIGSSSFCVSTSLHCRIISAAYGVKRVSISDGHKKNTDYSSFWDPDYPTIDKASDIESAVRVALNTKDHTNSIEKNSCNNFEEAFSVVNETGSNVPTLNSLQKVVLEDLYGIHTRCFFSLQKEYNNLSAESEAKDRHILAQEERIKSMYMSNTWRAGRLITYLPRKIWKLLGRSN
jgi:polysaccharide pyruvyl transferase WcaK-like protein